MFMLTQEPSPPAPEEPTAFLFSPITYIVIILIIAGVVAWKYKAIHEFIVIVCSTIGCFIVGFIAIPDYPSFGLASALALAGLLISIAAVTFVRMLKTKK